MFLKVSAGVLLVLLAVIGYASTFPSEFSYSRSVEIQADPAQVFPLINNLNEWKKWSPYEKLDPQMKKVVGGGSGAIGVGAFIDWKGNSDAGAGKMEITSSVAPSDIVMSLQLVEPMEAHHDMRFNLIATSTGSRVTWTTSGKNSLMTQVASLFLNFEEMIGDPLSEGLTNLKQLVESR